MNIDKLMAHLLLVDIHADNAIDVAILLLFKTCPLIQRQSALGAI